MLIGVCDLDTAADGASLLLLNLEGCIPKEAGEGKSIRFLSIPKRLSNALDVVDDDGRPMMTGDP